MPEAHTNAFVILNIMDEIIDNLYVGSAMGESNKEMLDAYGITHILTVASQYPPTFPNGYHYKSISIDDLPEANIIQYFTECNDFISKAINEEGGKVLVHCMAGQSRSATIVAAYMMQRDQLTMAEALVAMKEKRMQIHPNVGFIKQLELYYDLGYEVSNQKALYRRFLVCNNIEHYHEYGSVGEVVAGMDPTSMAGSSTQRLMRCKKCRRELVTEANIIDHQAGIGEMAFSFKKRSANGGGAHTPHAFPQDQACSSLFVEPMEWMEGLQDGLLENKINCPKCAAKLGSYNWFGAQCSCGKWITPSFQIHRNRVDEIHQKQSL